MNMTMRLVLAERLKRKHPALYSIPMDISVKEAAAIMTEKGIGAVLVKDTNDDDGKAWHANPETYWIHSNALQRNEHKNNLPAVHFNLDRVLVTSMSSTDLPALWENCQEPQAPSGHNTSRRLQQEVSLS